MTPKQKADKIYNLLLEKLPLVNLKNIDAATKKIALFIIDEVKESCPKYSNDNINKPDSYQDLINNTIEYFNEVENKIKLL